MVVNNQLQVLASLPWKMCPNKERQNQPWIWSGCCGKKWQCGTLSHI